MRDFRMKRGAPTGKVAVAEPPDRRPGLPGPLFNALSQYARQAEIPPDWSKPWPSEGNAIAT